MVMVLYNPSMHSNTIFIFCIFMVFCLSPLLNVLAILVILVTGTKQSNLTTNDLSFTIKKLLPKLHPHVFTYSLAVGLNGHAAVLLLYELVSKQNPGGMVLLV